MLSVYDDIAQMYANRLRQLLEDCGDTAIRAGLDIDKVSTLLASGLMTEIMIGCQAIHMSEDKWLQVCANARKDMLALRKDV